MSEHKLQRTTQITQGGSMESHRIAQSVIDKAISTGSVIAVFVSNGSVKMTKTTTGLFMEAVQRKSDKWIGCYDERCQLDWLVDDLRAAGIR